MSNVERFRDNCLMEANGNREEAFNIACRKAVQYWLAMSPGFVKEHLPSVKPPQPRVEPILLESERAGNP